jgi:hypothetical protein
MNIRNIRTPPARLGTIALAAMVALPFLAADAMAAKETFQRSKPHLNVGTIGHPPQEPGNLANSGGTGTTSPDADPDGKDCKPDPSKPADAQTC